MKLTSTVNEACFGCYRSRLYKTTHIFLLLYNSWNKFHFRLCQPHYAIAPLTLLSLQDGMKIVTK